MIPALLAVPTAANIVGGVVGGVVNAFTPSSPTPASTPAFNPYLQNASASSAPSTSTAGTLRSDDWSQMDSTSLKTWAQNLSGHHIYATDATGRTISGVVSGVTPLGNDLSLNVGGHLVALSQLKQISWSSAAV